MRVAVIEDTANHQQHRDVLHSLAQGSGAEITTSDRPEQYDCAVIFGSYKWHALHTTRNTVDW